TPVKLVSPNCVQPAKVPVSKPPLTTRSAEAPDGRASSPTQTATPIRKRVIIQFPLSAGRAGPVSDSLPTHVGAGHRLFPGTTYQGASASSVPVGLHGERRARRLIGATAVPVPMRREASFRRNYQRGMDIQIEPPPRQQTRVLPCC